MAGTSLKAIGRFVASPASRATEPGPAVTLPHTGAARGRWAVLAVLLGFLVFAALGRAEDQVDVVRLDWAYYNPLSLLLRKQGLLAAELQKQGTRVEWVQSLGSNKALEFLRSNSIDFGSTAGAAALLGRANGNPIRAVYVYSHPEWTMLLTRAGTGIQSLAQLKGKRVAVTRGTDPHIFLLRALASVGLTEADLEIVPLQHPDGKVALERGDVDAWAGLDPYIAQLEVKAGFPIFFRNKEWNSGGVLNVRAAFVEQHPALVQQVISFYEQARRWAVAHSREATAILAEEAQLSPEVADQVWARNDFSDGTLGDPLRRVLLASGEVLKQSQVIDPGTDVAKVLDKLLEPRYAALADSGAAR